MSQNIPTQLKYTKDHEWAQIENGIATVGITDFAQNSLGDIVFVELPEAGNTYAAGETFGVVESIKSVSDLYSPFSGEILEKNSSLEAQPDLCNQAPYDSWMIKIKLSNESEISELLDAQAYQAHCDSLS